ncbi:hypothetical protein QBZ16_001590 [Prototheca wickerhamii]|uniref:Phosphate transporter n=1 Tax=Prototheca wickerhamii TaxID=3111 RepID=A0AAD9IEY2_PROWI|nr:hypothetical protein QBZ16_001590 [Prototheca wickerhamii]
MAELEQFTWIFGLSVVFAFLTAVGIGANDMANSFATTVASRALTLGQVVILAGIMEFAGAVLLGAGVTSTIKSGIARLSAISAVPDVAMFGFLAVSMTTAFWDNFASYMALPVSMTHTTVGATVGMSLALFGGGAVIWSEDKDDFPWIGGMVPIFLSWVISPIMCGLITVILFGSIRQFVLRSDHSFARAFYVLPVLVFGMVWLIVAFIIQTGAKNDTWSDRGDGFAAWVGAVCGVGSGLFTLIIVMPRLRKKVLEEEHVGSLAEVGQRPAISQTASEPGKKGAALDGETAAPGALPGDSDGEPAHGELARQPTNAELHALRFAAKDKPWAEKTFWEKVQYNPVSNIILHNVRQDIHAVADTDVTVKGVHDNAELFDAKTESLFRYLQVFSACVMSFTHGANDVSNAMGPFAAVYQIWRTGEVSSKAATPEWVLVIGGVGISVGLALFGWRIIQILGVKMVKITNVRGFCAELATAITVAIASRYGLPVSTTMTITGGLIGVGLLEGFRGLNYRALIRIFCGWVLTLFIACGVCAGITAFGSYSPYKPGSVDISDAAVDLNATSTAMLAQMQAALNAAGNVADAGSIQSTLDALNASFYQIFAPTVKSITDMVDNNAAILGEFNATLAYNPFAQTPGALVPQ